MYKRCRFGAVEEDRDKSRLFVLTNPTSKPGKMSAYLQLWEPENGTLKKSTAFSENVAALAVRDDGRFVAVGTMFTGSVDIFVAFSLQVPQMRAHWSRGLLRKLVFSCFKFSFQRVLHVKSAHNMFITGLEFLPVTSDLISVTSNAEAAVISVSVDNRVCIHTLYHRRKCFLRGSGLKTWRTLVICTTPFFLSVSGSIPTWLAIILIVITLFCTFVLCSIIGL